MAGMVVAGMGAAGADPNLSDIGAWLASDGKSSISHVNGLTGQVDGRVQLPKNSKSQLQVSEDGKSVLVMDTTTGQVSRIDPAQLTVPQTADFQAGTQVFSGGGKAWLVDAAKGEVQAIDPVALAPLGPPVPVGARPLGTAQADPSGTLWIPVPATGQLVPFTTQPGAPIKVAEPGGALMLTLASGRPVVTDVVGGRLLVVSGTGIERTVTLPSELTKGKADKLQAPGRSEGPLVPILAADTGVLTLIDIDSGSVSAVPLKLGDHDFGPPQVLGAKVYIPDRTTGSLAVYNTVRNEFEPQLRVTGVPGPLEAYVRDGLLWVNAPNSARPPRWSTCRARSTSSASSTPTAPSPGRLPRVRPRRHPARASRKAASPPPGVRRPTRRRAATRPPGRNRLPAKHRRAARAVLPTPRLREPIRRSAGTSQATPGTPATRGTPAAPETTGTTKRRPTPVRPGPPSGPRSRCRRTRCRPGSRPIRGPARRTRRLPRRRRPHPAEPPDDDAAGTDDPAHAAADIGQADHDVAQAHDHVAQAHEHAADEGSGRSTVQSQPGKIYVTVTPASGATPTRYRLAGLSAGMGVSPASIPPKGPFTFTVTGGSCEKEYKFYIIADYPRRHDELAEFGRRPAVCRGR
ncbi:hypothetical protein ACU686_05580 [Yinghuangia aomiensis]